MSGWEGHLRAAEEEEGGDDEDYAECNPPSPVTPSAAAGVVCPAVAVVACGHGGGCMLL